MSNDIPAQVDASPEVREILQELEAEGKGETKPEAEPEKPAEAEKPKEEAPKAEQPKEGEQEKEKEKPTERTARHVPVSKYNEERHKRQEATAEAEKARQEAAELRAKLEATSKKPVEEGDVDLKELGQSLAEKHDLEPSFVNDLLEGVAKLTAKQQKDLPPDLKADLDELKRARAEMEVQKRQAAEDQHFDNELTKVITEFPDLASAKEALKELAFSEEHKTTPLRTIALAYQYENGAKPGRKTMETPTGSRNNTEVIDYKEMTEDKLKNLSEGEQDKYFDWLKRNPRG